MIRLATQRRDTAILRMRRTGVKAERIRFLLHLANVYLVYDAFRRERRLREDRRSVCRGPDRRLGQLRQEVA